MPKHETAQSVLPPAPRHRRPRATAVAVLGLAVTTALLVANPTAAATRHQQTGPGRAATAASTSGDLSAVSAVNKKDIWAVGYQVSAGVFSSLAEHYDGTSWSVRPTTMPNGSGNSYFEGVDAASSTDVWAVGYSVASSDQTGLTMAQHWNGKKWRLVPTPNPEGSSVSILSSVTEVAPDDVWAVGYQQVNGTDSTLVEHFDGSTWSIVASSTPSGGFNSALTGVTAISARNVVAVGNYFDNSGAELVMAERWNGTKWKLVDAPSAPGSPDSEVHGVSSTSADNAWAVGFNWSGSLFISLVEHWDGHAWSMVDSPNPGGSTDTYLYGVSADSATDAWAVGYYFDASIGYATLIEHWDGSSWTVVDSPNPPGSSNNYLYGVSAVSPTTATATGYDFQSQDNPLVESWNGKAWKLGSPA